MTARSTKPRRNRHRGDGATSRRIVAAIAALVEPLTIAELATRIGVHWRTGYRLVDELLALDVIEDWGVDERAKRYRLRDEWPRGKKVARGKGR